MFIRNGDGGKKYGIEIKEMLFRVQAQVLEMSIYNFEFSQYKLLENIFSDWKILMNKKEKKIYSKVLEDLFLDWKFFMHITVGEYFSRLEISDE